MNSRESYSDRMIMLLQGGDAVRQATDGARAFSDGRGLSPHELARVCVVIEELVVNLYDHGGLTEQDQVELTLASEPGAFRIIIVDGGAPFDPRAVPARKASADRGAGAGIGIVRSWARIIDYASTAEGNRLDMLIPLESVG